MGGRPSRPLVDLAALPCRLVLFRWWCGNRFLFHFATKAKNATVCDREVGSYVNSALRVLSCGLGAHCDM